MKVTLEVGPDAEVEVTKDDAGNIVAIEFNPLFAKSRGAAVLAYGVAKNDKGKLLDRFTVSVSGATGKVTKTGRVEPTAAAVDSAADEDDPEADPPAKK